MKNKNENKDLFVTDIAFEATEADFQVQEHTLYHTGENQSKIKVSVIN